jgi:hypothetical protein
MKYLTCALIFVLISGCSNLDEKNTLEYTWQAMHVIDVLQTANGIAGSNGCVKESDPLTRALIGEHPNKNDVYVWGASIAVLHWFGMKWLDDKMPDSALVRVADNVLKFRTVGHNHKQGIRVDGMTDELKTICDELGFTSGPSIGIPLYRF